MGHKDAVIDSGTVTRNTCGELFLSSGATIDLLRGGKLLLATADGCSVSANINHDDIEYTATPLVPVLADALQLPREVQDHVSTRQLFDRMRDDLLQTTGLTDSQAFLATTWILATHLAGAVRLPMLNLWAEGSCDSPLTQFASMTCRRPLPLADASLCNLLELPVGLAPTLILAQPKENFLRPLQNSTSLVGYRSLRKQGLVQFRGSVLACSARPLQLPCLPLSLVSEPAARVPIATPKLIQLADTYQPQGLNFRLTSWLRALHSGFDATQFSPAVRMWVRSLGAVLEGEPELQQELLEVAVELDQRQREQLAQSTAALVLWAILTAVRRNQGSVYVHDLADAVNLALEARHETGSLTPKAIGLVVREELGLDPRRARDGYRLLLEPPVVARLFDLAGRFGIEVDLPEIETDGEAQQSATVTVTGEVR